MSNREKCNIILDSFSETQLADIATMLQAAKNAIDEALDDAFCEKLCEEYDADPDKGDPISLEEFAQQLGVAL